MTVSAMHTRHSMSEKQLLEWCCASCNFYNWTTLYGCSRVIHASSPVSLDQVFCAPSLQVNSAVCETATQQGFRKQNIRQELTCWVKCRSRRSLQLCHECLVSMESHGVCKNPCNFCQLDTNHTCVMCEPLAGVCNHTPITHVL